MVEGELEQRFFDSLHDVVIKEVWREARKEMRACTLCPLKCGADRMKGFQGACGASLTGEVFYAGLLVNEEHDLNPSYEVFFTGCNLGCRFCYLADKVRSKGGSADTFSPLPLWGHPLYNDAAVHDAKTLSAVGGEPAVNLLGALYLYDTVEVRPRVWNSNMYYGQFVSEAVSRVADVVVADVHFGNNNCASRIAGAGDYLEKVFTTIGRAVSAGCEVIIRHLVLPGHVDCCALPVMQRAAYEFPGVRFHLLFNYMPPPPLQASSTPELLNKPAFVEVNRALEKADELGLRMEPARVEGSCQGNVGGVSEVFSASSPECGEIIIDTDGEIFIPHLTPGLQDVLACMKEETNVQVRDE